MINAVVSNPNNPRQPMLEKAVLRIAVALVASLALLASPIDRAFAGQPTIGEWEPNGEKETERTRVFTNPGEIRRQQVEELAETGRLSIGEQSGPRIGIEEGPLPGIGTGLSRWRIGGSRARRAVFSQATERRAWEVPVCPPGQAGVALSYGV
jgi:hypothetical protein